MPIKRFDDDAVAVDADHFADLGSACRLYADEFTELDETGQPRDPEMGRGDLRNSSADAWKWCVLLQLQQRRLKLPHSVQQNSLIPKFHRSSGPAQDLAGSPRVRIAFSMELSVPCMSVFVASKARDAEIRWVSYSIGLAPDPS